MSNHNNGFAYGANRAIEAAHGDYLMLINPDVILFPHTIDRLINFIEQKPRCAVVGPEILSRRGYYQPNCRRFPTYFNVLFGRRSLARRFLPNNPVSRRYLYLDISHKAPQQVELLEGSVMVLRQKALNEVGLFDEDFFLYCEDADICYRLKQKDWQVWWLPGVYAIHFRGENIRRDNLQATLHHSRSLYKFFLKYYRPARLIKFVLHKLLALRLCYLVVVESIKGLCYDINFSPSK